MKILHTSDWHLGQVFYNYDRTMEQQDMLQQITNIISEEQPDAMVVSGDIFHTSNPSAAAVEMYNNAVLSMHTACPTMQIVVTAGNHDSAARLVVNNALWKHFQVTVIGHIAKDADRNPDYAPHLIAVNDGNGNKIGYIAAIPHSFDSNFPTTNPDLKSSDRTSAYFSGLAEYVKAKNTEGLPVVLMAHLAISGCDFAGHDIIGGMESKEVNLLGDIYDYVALGHIHTPQDINSRVRYCGTPIPVNFGEKFEHSVSIVTLDRGKEPIIVTKAIKNLIPLHDFPTQLPDKDAIEDELDEAHRPLTFNEVLEKLKDFDSDKLCYLRIVVRVDETLKPLANTEIEQALKGKKCRFCQLRAFMFNKEKNKAEQAQTVKFSTDEFKTKTPMEIAELFIAMKGLTLSDRQKEIIRESTTEADQ